MIKIVDIPIELDEQDIEEIETAFISKSKDHAANSKESEGDGFLVWLEI